MATLTIADLDNGKRDLETVDAVANSRADTTTTRYGQQTLTLAGALRRLGYQPPVPFAPGLGVDSPLITVTYGDPSVTYAPNPDLVPFTTGAWNPDQWRVVQGDVGLREDLEKASGAGLIGYQSGAAGASVISLKKLNDVRMRSVVEFGAAVGAPAAQNDAAFARAALWLQTESSGFGTANLSFPSGIFDYTTGPNWAASRAFLHCEPGTVFNHLGAGPAVTFDGGAIGGGIFVCGLLGRPLIKGNANTTDALYTRAVHRSRFEARIRDVKTTAARVVWNVCSEFDLRCSPLGEPAFSTIPVTGVLLEARTGEEYTSACTFYNPVMEGLSGYGINIQGGIMNTFLGGTSESNGGGISIAADMFGNTFVNMDCEFNTGHDLFCNGSQNTFINLLADRLVEFTGASSANVMRGGRVNTLTDGGSGNDLEDVRYGIAGGAFTPSATTVHRGMRNALASGALIPGVNTQIWGVNTFGSSDAERLLVGRADTISGGPAADVDIFKVGTGTAHLRAPGGVTALSFGSDGLSFYGAPPAGRPVVSGSTGGNAALLSLVQALATLGLINNTTT